SGVNNFVLTTIENAPYWEDIIMKKIMSLIVVLATATALSGCLFGKKEEAAPETPAMETPATTEEMPATDAAPTEAPPADAAPAEGTGH
ncbi:MAG: hypothetical protein AABZ31_08415, partial [Bdellovibrionota bacterium]